MNDEHLEITEELRQLREDYSTIKKELEREKIVNEELLDSTFKRNVRTIMGDKKLSIIAGLIAAFLLPMIGFLFAAPFKYIAILEIYVLALTSVYILFYKKYDFNMIPSFDVLNASRMMKEFKKSYTHMIFISWSGNRNTRIFLSNDNQSLEYSFKSDMCNLISGYSPRCLPVSRVPLFKEDY